MSDTRGTPKADKTHPCPLLLDIHTLSVIRSLLVHSLSLSLPDLVPLFSKPLLFGFLAKMKLNTLSVCLLYAAGSLVQANPVYRNANTSEAAATKQINDWQAQYNKYIEATIKTRQVGCTAENIVKRQEWYVSLHHGIMKPGNVLT